MSHHGVSPSSARFRPQYNNQPILPYNQNNYQQPPPQPGPPNHMYGRPQYFPPQQPPPQNMRMIQPLTIQNTNPAIKQQPGKPLPQLPCTPIEPYSLPQLWTYLELKKGFVFERTDENINVYPDRDSFNTDGRGHTFTIPPPQTIYIPESTKLNFRKLKIQMWLCEVTVEKKQTGMGAPIHTLEDASALCCIAEQPVTYKGNYITFDEAVRFRYNNTSTLFTLKQFFRFILINAENMTIVSFVDSCLFSIVRHHRYANSPLSPPSTPPLRETPPSYSQPPSKPMHNSYSHQPLRPMQPAPTAPQTREVDIVQTLLEIFIKTNLKQNHLDRIYGILHQIKSIATDSGKTTGAQKLSEDFVKKRKLEEALSECREAVERDTKRQKTNHDEERRRELNKSSTAPPPNVIDPNLAILYTVTKYYDDFNMEPIAILHLKNLDVYRVDDLKIKFGKTIITHKEILDVRPSGIRIKAPQRHKDDPNCVKVSLSVTFNRKEAKYTLKDAYSFDEFTQEDDWTDNIDPNPPSTPHVAIYHSESLSIDTAHIGRGKTISTDMSRMHRLFVYSDNQRYDTRIDFFIKDLNASQKLFGSLSAANFEWWIVAVEGQEKIKLESPTPATTCFRRSDDDSQLEFENQNIKFDIAIFKLSILIPTQEAKNEGKWWTMQLKETNTTYTWFQSSPFVFTQKRKTLLPDVKFYTSAMDKQPINTPRNVLGQTKLHGLVTGQNVIMNIAPLVTLTDHFNRTPLQLAFALGELEPAKKIMKHIYEFYKRKEHSSLSDLCLALLRMDTFRNTAFHLAIKNDHMDFLKKICEWMAREFDWQKTILPAIVNVDDEDVEHVPNEKKPDVVAPTPPPEKIVESHTASGIISHSPAMQDTVGEDQEDEPDQPPEWLD